MRIQTARAKAAGTTQYIFDIRVISDECAVIRRWLQTVVSLSPEGAATGMHCKVVHDGEPKLSVWSSMTHGRIGANQVREI